MNTRTIIMQSLMASVMLMIAITGYTQNRKTFAFTIEGMTCQGCVNTAAQTLKNVKGVDSVSIDLDSKRAIVIADSNVSQNDLKDALSAKTSFEALFAGETLLQPLSEEEKAGLDIQTLKGGSKINFNNHISKGKITVFDFYADWCGPCRLYSPKVERLLLENKSLALRKVDVVNWQSDLAKQLTKDYRIPALPFTLIFDNKGKLLGRVEGNSIGRVKEIISSQ